MTHDIEKIKALMEFTKSLHVLYVEDNDEARTQTLKMLKNFFSEIDIGIDGLDGLEKFTSYYNKTGSYYDLIISDINMPNMDGISMSKKIVTQNPNQQIIVISAFNDSQNFEEALSSGVKYYIHKPIELKSLVSTIQKATSKLGELALV